MILNTTAEDVVKTLAALAQQTRLLAFKELIKAHAIESDAGGLAAGELAKKLGTASSTLSFHLKEMHWAGLITSRKEGRSVIYKANLDSMQSLVTYLLEDCCGGVCGSATPQPKLNSGKIPETTK